MENLSKQTRLIRIENDSRVNIYISWVQFAITYNIIKNQIIFVLFYRHTCHLKALFYLCILIF